MTEHRSLRRPFGATSAGVNLQTHKWKARHRASICGEMCICFCLQMESRGSPASQRSSDGWMEGGSIDKIVHNKTGQRSDGSTETRRMFNFMGINMIGPLPTGTTIFPPEKGHKTFTLPAPISGAPEASRCATTMCVDGQHRL